LQCGLYFCHEKDRNWLDVALAESLELTKASTISPWEPSALSQDSPLRPPSEETGDEIPRNLSAYGPLGRLAAVHGQVTFDTTDPTFISETHATLFAAPGTLCASSSPFDNTTSSDLIANSLYSTPGYEPRWSDSATSFSVPSNKLSTSTCYTSPSQSVRTIAFTPRPDPLPLPRVTPVYHCPGCPRIHARTQARK
jgi:hypothetical protein